MRKANKCELFIIVRSASTSVAMQVTFAFTAAISWDKVPNYYGQKSIGIDPTGVIRAGDGAWASDVASVGCQLILIAIHQRILLPSDLHNLAIGEPFTMASLVGARDPALGEGVGNMCDLGNARTVLA